MTPLMFVGYMTCLLFGSVAYLAASKTSFFHFESALVGQDLTLKCFYQDRDGAIFYWYKMTQGQKPQLMSEFYKHRSNGSFKGNFMNNPQFDLETGSGKNHLKISNIQMSDSATYYCASIFSYVYEFLEGFIVDVKGSGLTIQALVHQSASETVHPGGSVTLNCTVQTGSCDGEHSVYWFKNSKEGFPRIIYTQGGSNNQCEMKPSTKTQTCRYNLPFKDLNGSHAGTYYCAVASCGHILFGHEMTLDTEEKVDSLVVVYILSGAMAFTITLVVFLAFKLYKKRNCKCKDPPKSCSTDAAASADGYEDADNLHYAALNEKNISRLRNDADPWFVVFLLSGTLVFTSILSISLIFSVCMMNKAKSSKSSGLLCPPTTNIKGFQCGENTGLNLISRSGIQRDPTWTKCVYYTVKQ
ncbi:uncharacterized protein LOC108244263 isoform X2 [Kryptolebias marmoratus]|uniref:uncharacterized protein LOC108244263 isoform X2 n=1 Tax=Kryptolebias marmoratus TaxID=37003 RepID=UPI0018ACEDF6|nr:uncharacterized protein LOC108244263 isoform X2 [Kryptolebias marmoratus]